MIFAFGFSNVLTIILFLLIICFVIAWHELGHLVMAKKSNVYCYEYSIGFGPALYTNKKKETYFVLRSIPLGGFVKMAGEDGDTLGEEVKDNNGNVIPSDRILANISKGKKIGVLAAGGIMNMILAVVCFYVYIAFSGGFTVAKTDSRITVFANSVLEEKGMESGDSITSISTYLENSNGTIEIVRADFNTSTINDVTNALGYALPKENGQIQHITIMFKDASENNEIKSIDVTREASLNENGELQVSKMGMTQYFIAYHYNAFSGLWGAWHLMGETTIGTFKAFGKIFQGDMSQLSGLVGIYETVDSFATAQEVSVGDRIVNIIYLTGAISFSLGFFNLIPFPALDGGRIVFVLYSLITKKKVNPNVEATIHFVGLVLLFGLMIIINVKDIIKLFAILI